MRGFVCLAALCALLALAPAGTCTAGEVDYTAYAGLLQKHVSQGVVDYRGLKQNEAELDAALAAMAAANPDGLSPNRQKALYINAYNAWTLKLVLMHYPGIKSIKDIGGPLSGPWKQNIVKLGCRLYTLDNLEHDILRKEFKDPRIHFAINSASKGCPPLRSLPYLGRDLDSALDRATADFFNDPKRTFIRGNTLYLTRIMDWFEKDFGGDQVGFVMRHAGEGLKGKLQQAGGDIDIEYLPYDWSLNGQ